ncbi:hypothetical protein FJ208_02360, partial [Candidatus Gribaldobacteria bacterium]|nr:hypothetical protein [Candidatus Gribaldobacteria bacterium]
LNLPVQNDACETLIRIKQKLAEFFVSNQYGKFDEYLNQAKNILRSIEKEWAKSLPAGNEAVIARGYLEKTLNLIFHSQKLVANTKQQNIVCNRPDNNYLVLLDWQAPIPGLASLINELAGIIQEIIDLTNSPIFNSAHQSVKTELNNLTNELVSPVNLVRKNILDEIQTKIGSSYGCARGETGFLHKIACFEFDNQRKTCDLLYFIDVLDVFFASQEKITETKQAIELLKPQIKMEFSQQDPRKAVEMIKQEPLGKFPFWEDDGQTIKIAGIPIKGFADFKEAVNKNPIVFLTGLYNAIKKNLKTIRDELDKAQLKITKDEIFGKDPRKNNYVNPLVDFKSQNLTDLQRKVFGDDNLTAACKLISPILQSDPRNVWASCQNASYNLLGNTNLEKKCYTILQLDLSVLAMQPDEIQAEINRLTKQRKAAGVYDLQCPPKMNEAVRNGVCPTVNQGLNQNLDGQHLGNGTWCWPPTKQPLDKNDYTQGYQAVASFCRQTEERLNELGATGFDEICSLVNSAVADSLIKADAFIPNSACNNQTQANLDIMNNGVDVLLAKCSELESQKALEKECQYIQMLREHVFNGSCNLTACSQQENDDFA